MSSVVGGFEVVLARWRVVMKDYSNFFEEK
jgi:hypothetical protein